jgi:hypothetical protein
MKNVIKRWIGSASPAGPSSKNSQSLLLGGVDLVTPSIINGWVWHPEYKLFDVRLLSGGSLLATAAIDVHRKDVEDKVRAKGSFGFSVKLPVRLPSIDLAKDLQLFALTEDGSKRFLLSCMKDKESTLTLLRTALDPQYFGMEGNFDGLAGDGLLATGWCFQKLVPSQPCVVYVRVEGMEPVPVRCDQYRPGFSSMGYPESCGFSFRISELNGLSEFGGRRLTVTFDHSGLLSLPEPSPSFLPDSASVAELVRSSVFQDDLAGEHGCDSLEIHSPEAYADLPDSARYRRDLEEFKRVCDVFEREIRAQIQQEAFSKRAKERRIGGWKRLFRG